MDFDAAPVFDMALLKDIGLVLAAFFSVAVGCVSAFISAWTFRRSVKADQERRNHEVLQLAMQVDVNVSHLEAILQRVKWSTKNKMTTPYSETARSIEHLEDILKNRRCWQWEAMEFIGRKDLSTLTDDQITKHHVEWRAHFLRTEADRAHFENILTYADTEGFGP